MKKSRQQINEIIAEEFKLMLESGELTEEQIDEIWKQLGGALKGAGTGLRSFGRHIKKGWQKGSKADKAAKAGKEAERTKNLPTSGWYSQPIQQKNSPESTKPDVEQETETKESLIKRQILKLQKDYEAIAGQGSSDELNGKVIVKTPAGSLELLEPNDDLAKKAYKQKMDSLVQNTQVPAAATSDVSSLPSDEGSKIARPAHEMHKKLDQLEKQRDQAQAEGNIDKVNQLSAEINDLRVKAQNLEENKQYNRIKKLAGIIKG